MPHFALPASRSAKAAPALVADDEQFFDTLAACLAEQVADLERRLSAERAAPVRHGTAVLERDQEVHRLTARLRTLRRYGVDLCLGRIVTPDAVVHVGRLGLTGAGGERLLVDWRSPAAEPFFAASHADPMGLVSRRRYRWTRGQVTDFWDEVFTDDGLADNAALDDHSAFLATLAGARSAQMRDVLGTIAADQDAVVRASAAGPLVVDGGPGTGKTVVALHRTAYLLHADPQVGQHRGGVLVVGPHEPYLAYTADVLPSLGEDGVRTATLRDLVPEGRAAGVETDAVVAALKAGLDVEAVVEAVVAFSEEPPRTATVLDTPWGEVRLGRAEWAEAFGVVDPGTPHDDARDEVWDELVLLVADRLEEAEPDRLRRWLAQDADLVRAFDVAWPLLDAADVVADLWSVPALLRRCAPGLTADDVRALQRTDPRAWTTADLPLLDAARRRVGDPAASRRRRATEAETAAQRARMDDVVADLIAADDSELKLMHSLRQADLRDALVDPGGWDAADPDRLAGPFAHVVVDEAQELSDAEWAMLLARCPSRSLTVVGDRAQARHGFRESWVDRLARVGLPGARLATLGVNYRTPSEVMAVAEPEIRAAVPDANVPTSIRASGVPVRYGPASSLPDVLTGWLAAHADGVACVVGAPAPVDSPRVRALSPVLAKGLEFDLVVLVDPAALGDGVEGAVDRYVAMTRATAELVVLTT
ncbi:DNA helicase IV [Klenkia soli]|uniref:DNA helicase IV n=1 Tax=Klenkia soli TaxID=1052260 RepID=A0A1H0E8S8_9ACTN|nr:RNA polymerase recycling motor ATPase HelR [Klenkia soli]SDN78743.1 DNA helicase IV [Klenkia soli]